MASPLNIASSSSHTLPHSPRPRLRSCLSPTRLSSSPTFFNESLPSCSPANSRSTSFSSSTSDAWIKRTKCVRWQEMNGCAVTSTHHTYSQEEYDRTPLEPPTIAERQCVLPERGSRSLSTFRDCFYTDLTDDEEDVPSSTTDDVSNDSLLLHTPPSTEDNSDEETDDAERDEDKQWEECMERRRMMFARMCPAQVEGDDRRHPEFEGYRSITSTLAELLRSVGCTEDDQDDRAASPSTPLPTPMADTEAVFESGLSLRRFSREDVEEVDTPSLVSSAEAESETELSIASPTPADHDHHHEHVSSPVEESPSPSPIHDHIPTWPEHTSTRMNSISGGKSGMDEMRGRSRIDLDGRVI